MKKITKLIAILTLAVALLAPSSASALNKKILTLDAEFTSDTTLSVSGSAEDGALAVSIAVYELNGGTTPVIIETASVLDNNTFSHTLTIARGTYIVKVADYDRGEVKSVTVREQQSSVSNSASSEDVSSSPKTGVNTRDDDSGAVGFAWGTSIIAVAALSLLAVRKFAKRS